MCTLAINAGSSSLRISLFDATGKLLFKGHADGIGQRDSQFRDKTKKVEKVINKSFKDHQAALEFMWTRLPNQKIDATVHRIVHGGSHFTRHQKLQLRQLKELEKLSSLAPSHLPAEIAALSWALKKFPKSFHYGFFDTAFHHSLPDVEKYYGIPLKIAKKEGWHRYGFHGLSCEYLLKSAQKILKKKQPKLLICHLGNGCSVTAVKKNQSVATSMGMTPLEGPMMGTRSGSMDPGLLLAMVEKQGLNKTRTLLTHESGFLGVSGITSDVRPLLKSKQKQAIFTLELFARQVAECIAQKRVALGATPDAIIFSGGIGENASKLRQKILRQLPFSVGKTLVIPTDEERFMAESIKQPIQKPTRKARSK